MYICFNQDFYKIEGIQINTDNAGLPVDICIKVKVEDENVLDNIAENHCLLGYNKNPYNSESEYMFALYGRLDSFHLEWTEPEVYEHIDW